MARGVVMTVEWSEVTSTEWEEELTRLPWEARRDTTGRVFAYQLQASCPRCGDAPAIDLEHPVQIITDRAPAASVVVEKYVQCDCQGDHPGRPTDESGCGSRASISFTIPSGANR
jgi:hypothetical protein